MVDVISRLPFYEVCSRQSREQIPKYDWGAKQLGIDKLHQSVRGKGVIGAVLDTGVDHLHHDLNDNILGSESFVPREDAMDTEGHGTHCAGIISANGHLTGIAPDCKLVCAKVLDNRGSGRNEWIIKALRWIGSGSAGPIDFVSMSLGSPQHDIRLLEAILSVIDKGIMVIVAAGNEGRPDSVDFPGFYSHVTAGVITVGSINADGAISDFSSRGEAVSICSPGENILSTFPNNAYATLSGTSMATPFVAGCVALHISSLKEKTGKMKLSMADTITVRDAVIRTAVDVDQPGFDPNSGWGLVSPRDAINYTPPVAKPVDPKNPSQGNPVSIPIVGPVQMHVPARAGDQISFNW